MSEADEDLDEDDVETKILPMSPGADVSRGGWIVNFNPNRGTNKRQAVRSSQHTKDRQVLGSCGAKNTFRSADRSKEHAPAVRPGGLQLFAGALRPTWSVGSVSCCVHR